MSINEDKKSLRTTYRTRRREIAPQEREAADAAIARRVVTSDEYRDCDLVLIYVSRDNEVDTRRIIDTALYEGKRVAVPRCVVGTKDLQFYCISGHDELVCGAYGIPEPPADPERLVTDTALSICVVPALAYDEDGYRLGYGGGYYDRFLAEYKGTAIGLCYSDCMQETLPRDAYDQRVTVLITERYIRYLRTKGEER